MWTRSSNGRRPGVIDAVLEVGAAGDLSRRLHSRDDLPGKFDQLIVVILMLRFVGPQAATKMSTHKPMPIASGALVLDGLPNRSRTLPDFGAHVYDDPDDGFRYVVSNLWIPDLRQPFTTSPLTGLLVLGSNDEIQTGGVDISFDGHRLSLSNENGSVEIDETSGRVWRPAQSSGNN
jgi:hypothetical protein